VSIFNISFLALLAAVSIVNWPLIKKSVSMIMMTMMKQ